MPKETRRPRNSRRHRLTAEDRARFARERRELVGSVITQEEFRGAFVVEHIRGSQYLIRLVDGTEVFASHKKQKEALGGVSKGGWKLWEDRR
jgi:hypothetical protein